MEGKHCQNALSANMLLHEDKIEKRAVRSWKRPDSTLFRLIRTAYTQPNPTKTMLSTPLELSTKKGHKREEYAGDASPKGDGMFVNRAPVAKHQPTDGADITPPRHRKTSKTSTHVPKKMEQLG